ncbi:unnamed protein product, partial [Staurois parvus]
MWHWCGTDGHWYVALMSTDRWHFWGYTDHQDTLIISALRHFPCLHVISCNWTQL